MGAIPGLCLLLLAVVKGAAPGRDQIGKAGVVLGVEWHSGCKGCSSELVGGRLRGAEVPGFEADGGNGGGTGAGQLFQREHGPWWQSM